MKTIEPIPTLALYDLLHMAASAIEDLLEHTDPNTSYYSGMWADVPGKLRSAMLQAGNSPVIPEWIPVSERMPEYGDYLVTDGCDFDVQLFNGEQFIPALCGGQNNPLDAAASRPAGGER